MKLSEQEFERVVAWGIDEIPESYGNAIDNLVFAVEAEPSDEQRRRHRLGPHQTLFGLYEGVPLTQRASNYNLVLPDRITIFQNPIEQVSRTLEELRTNVKHTIWHEVAHYFGLDHDRIHALERKRP